MTSISPHESPRPRRSNHHDIGAPSRSVRTRASRRQAAQHSRKRRRTLGRYRDRAGRLREVVARAGSAGSMLIVDRDVETLGDRRLVAHLSADEPPENATLVCRSYLEAARLGRSGCRLLTPADARSAPFAESQAPELFAAPGAWDDVLRDGRGRAHRLELVRTGMSIPELRWRRSSPEQAGGDWTVTSVREVVADLESYEPTRTLTLSALARHGQDLEVSTTVLRVELERVLESPILLNRRLRAAVLATLQRQELSMSEIAIRCGRIKHDRKGNESGETSWLARRLGMLPEGGHDAPTPWIHSDVLGLIARSGLGISPREVEL
jgi:hypothetical protein